MPSMDIFHPRAMQRKLTKRDVVTYMETIIPCIAMDEDEADGFETAEARREIETADSDLLTICGEYVSSYKRGVLPDNEL